MTRTIFTAIFITLFSFSHSNARSLTPQEALDRALNTTKTGNVTILAENTDKTHYNLAKTTPEYYVFNREEGGYIIVSADDRIYEILADVENGTFNPDCIPGLKWLTDLYTTEIREFIKRADLPESKSGDSANSPDQYLSLPQLYSKWTDIEPIMTTRWGQSSPYNDLCPIKNGTRSVTGCTATAMAQVVKAIGYYNGTGYRSLGHDEQGNPIEFDYTSADFNLKGMKDAYTAASTDNEKSEIANLMLACGIGTGMKYGNESSSAFTTNVATALINYFGFDPDNTYFMDRENFNAAEWERVIYTELSLGRPVHYSGGGHAYVIDGYRSRGLYHVNWGWDGAQQGFFRLSALIPPQSGENFSTAQQMSKSVPPGADPGYTPECVKGLNGGIFYNENGTFNIRFTSLGLNLDTSLGVILMDEDNDIAARMVFWSGNQLFKGSSIHDPKHTCDFSELNLPAGVYKIYPAYMNKTETQLRITRPRTDMPHFILLNVDSDGQCECFNTKPELFLADVTLPEECFSGHPANISVTLVNDMQVDYAGTISIGLSKKGNDTESTPLCSVSSEMTIYAGDNRSAECTLSLCDTANNPLPPGEYTITCTDKNGFRLDNNEYSLSLADGSPKPGWSSSESLRIENATDIPELLTAGETWPHTAQVVCTKSKKAKIGVTFYIPDKNTIVKNYYIYNSNINTGSMYYLYSADDFTIDIPFGTYDVAYTNNLSEISARKRVRVSQDGNNGFSFAPHGQNEASIVKHHAGSFSGHVTIPDNVEFDGSEYPVTAIEPEAFAGCRSLLSIDIPSSVKQIGTNAFAYCEALEQIHLHSDNPVFKYINLIAPGLSENCSIYTSPSAWDRYNETCSRNNLYSLIQSIESLPVTADGPEKAAIGIVPSHHATNKNFSISATDSATDPIATVTITDVQPGYITIDINPIRIGTQNFRIESEQLGVEPATITLNVCGTSGINEIEDDVETGVSTIYDLMGRPVSDKHKCKPGIYIIVSGDKSKKIIIPRN